VHIEDLRHYRLSESIFVRFPRWSFRIFYEGIEERIDDVVKRVDYFYGIVLIIVGPYITIFEFSDEGEVDLVAVVRTVRRNYSRNKTATTKTSKHAKDAVATRYRGWCEDFDNTVKDESDKDNKRPRKRSPCRHQRI
jgi:hypothetical protein